MQRHLMQANLVKYLKRKQRHRILRKIILLGIVLIAGIGSWAWYHSAMNEAQNTFRQAYQPIHHRHHHLGFTQADPRLKAKQPISVLLLGTDTGALGRHFKGRTDALIVMTINPSTHTTTMTNIPRDTKVQLPNEGAQKINAAYTFGGAALSEKTVHQLLNVPIDYYAIVNMRGLEKMIQASDGVTVTPSLTFKYGAADVKKGQRIDLSPQAALDYVRMRHQDPRGDYGRQDRQKQVIKALIMKDIQWQSAIRYHQILKSLNGNLQTDFNFADLMCLQQNYRSATHHMKNFEMVEQNAQINGIDYQVADKDLTNKIGQQINEALKERTD